MTDIELIREAAQMLEIGNWRGTPNKLRALADRLEAQSKAEPVGEVQVNGRGSPVGYLDIELPAGTKLYTHPASDEVERLKARIEELDDSLTEEIKNRDFAEDIGTKLAEAVGEHFRVDVGEHSNMNDPRIVALAIVEGEYITDSDTDRKLAAVEAQLSAIRQAVENALIVSTTSKTEKHSGLWKTFVELHAEDWQAILDAINPAPVVNQQLTTANPAQEQGENNG